MMVNKYFLFWILVVLIGIGPLLVSGQSKIEKQAIQDSILQSMKDGVLVIRLKSYRNKLTKLEAAQDNPKYSQKDKKRFMERRDDIIRTRDRYNKELVQAFKTTYQFSDIRFIYDSSVRELNDGARQGIFLNDQLATNPNITIGDGDIYYFGESQTGTMGNSVSGLVLTDQSGHQMPSWLPNYFKHKSNLKAFFGIFSKDKYFYKPVLKVVEKFQRKLDEFSVQIKNNIHQ